MQMLNDTSANSSSRVNGLPGNDDSGAMGVYAVWSYLGQSLVRSNRDAMLMLHLQAFIPSQVKIHIFSVDPSSRLSHSITKSLVLLPLSRRPTSQTRTSIFNLPP